MKKVTTAAILSAVLFASPVLAEEGVVKHEGGKHHGKHMEQFDTDKDGKISKAEHMAMANDRFAKMDTNGDGFVTKEEGKAHWEAKRAQWQAKKAEMGTKKAE